ncbi:hypothetical protein RND71_037667 [Anisodus tanguticus]|uniref:Uncharacterized protein n=1 Tax=Anisodus tanguticus TaxID=243964 RepID=A0AAE1QYY1_9SOLA|nr:hypothetical protein RND71_037667 [Anisodus tanguticus]
MADFEPPSFSLGLDFDIDSEPQSNVLLKPSVTLHTIKEVNDHNHDDDFVSPITGTDTDPKISDPPRSLKRLRRGSISKPEPVAQKLKLGKEAWCNVDDDIEEFSSQEDEPKDHPKCHSSVCSSSKIPLQGQRVLSSQSVSRCTGRKNEVSNVSSISQSMETSTSNLVFPELTISPLRRFQLIDSDSDDPSKSEVMEKESDNVDSPLNDQQNSGADFSFQRNSGPSAGTLKTKDLWEDFCSDRTFNIATPALDEVCEEYFKSVKDGKRTQSNSGLTESNMRPQGPLLPAHCYFFHKDPRIQKLVRDRLPNFFPLGAENIPGQKQDDASVIDYMGQFCHEGGSKKTSQKSAVVTNSRKGRKNVKQTNSVEESQGSERWVNPKSSAGVPKDAGRRRVQAVGKSAGHWYTSGDGKKVYVAKNGQEFSGQSAYGCYRKESGAGFKKSTKKTTGKRKAVSKKK